MWFRRNFLLILPLLVSLVVMLPARTIACQQLSSTASQPYASSYESTSESGYPSGLGWQEASAHPHVMMSPPHYARSQSPSQPQAASVWGQQQQQQQPQRYAAVPATTAFSAVDPLIPIFAFNAASPPHVAKVKKQASHASGPPAPQLMRPAHQPSPYPSSLSSPAQAAPAPSPAPTSSQAYADQADVTRETIESDSTLTTRQKAFLIRILNEMRAL